MTVSLQLRKFIRFALTIIPNPNLRARYHKKPNQNNFSFFWGRYMHLNTILVMDSLISTSIRTLNCRSARNDLTCQQLAHDMVNYKLKILAIQETHILSEDILDIRTEDNKHSFNLFNSGNENSNYTAVGFLLRKDRY